MNTSGCLKASHLVVIRNYSIPMFHGKNNNQKTIMHIKRVKGCQVVVSGPILSKLKVV